MAKKEYDYKIVPVHKATHADIKRLSKKYKMKMSDFVRCLVEDHIEYIEPSIDLTKEED